MGMTDTERRTLNAGTALATQITPTIEPLAVRLDEATRISDLSRSDLYRRASRGELTFLKAGSRVLVEMTSLRAAVAALPRATINIAA